EDQIRDGVRDVVDPTIGVLRFAKPELLDVPHGRSVVSVDGVLHEFPIVVPLRPHLVRLAAGGVAGIGEVASAVPIDRVFLRSVGKHLDHPLEGPGRHEVIAWLPAPLLPALAHPTLPTFLPRILALYLALAL